MDNGVKETGLPPQDEAGRHLDLLASMVEDFFQPLL
jgi:hypothetical protein